MLKLSLRRLSRRGESKRAEFLAKDFRMKEGLGFDGHRTKKSIMNRTDDGEC
jgi:hypothetical protein